MGTAIVELKATGDLLLMTQRAYPIVNRISDGKTEAQFVTAANNAFGKLVGDMRFIYDPGKKQITARTMLVSMSQTPNALSTALGVEISSNSPIPKLRGEIRLPKLEGHVDIFKYFAMDVKLVIETVARR